MKRFWDWYERHYTLNVTVAAALFTLQIVHLVWLTLDPLWANVFGDPLIVVEKPYSWPLLLVDYTEIPALIMVSLVYLNELRSGFAFWLDATTNSSVIQKMCSHWLFRKSRKSTGLSANPLRSSLR